MSHESFKFGSSEEQHVAKRRTDFNVVNILDISVYENLMQIRCSENPDLSLIWFYWLRPEWSGSDRFSSINYDKKFEPSGNIVKRSYFPNNDREAWTSVD